MSFMSKTTPKGEDLPGRVKQAQLHGFLDELEKLAVDPKWLSIGALGQGALSILDMPHGKDLKSVNERLVEKALKEEEDPEKKKKLEKLQRGAKSSAEVAPVMLLTAPAPILASRISKKLIGGIIGDVSLDVAQMIPKGKKADKVIRSLVPVKSEARRMLGRDVVLIPSNMPGVAAHELGHAALRTNKLPALFFNYGRSVGLMGGLLGGAAMLSAPKDPESAAVRQSIEGCRLHPEADTGSSQESRQSIWHVCVDFRVCRIADCCWCCR
jgi:hypothetical protein